MVLRKPPHQIKIPLNRPSLVGSELLYIGDALRRGQISGDGYYTRHCSTSFEDFLNVPRVLLTPSCTHALEMAFMLLPVRAGQEVICPSFTFPSTANAFVLRGLKPRFIDIRPDTLNIDERQLESLINRRTAAIVPVHYAGVPCRMDVIMKVARAHHLPVVEDAAQALGARFRGRLAGTFGALNAFSFHETKNCMCGEGGALAITQKRFVQRAEIIRQKGTNREAFYRGQTNKYSWVDEGSSYVPSELQSAFLMAQLEKMAVINKRRRRLYEYYRTALGPLEARGDLHLPVIPSDCESSYHLFHVLFESSRQRNRVMTGMQRRGIYATFHYLPLHSSPMGQHFGYRRGACPVTESVGERLLRLPLYNTLTAKQQDQVLEALKTHL